MYRFELKKDNLSQRHHFNQLNLSTLPNIQQEYQKSLIQGKIHNQQNSNKDIEYWYI